MQLFIGKITDLQLTATAGVKVGQVHFIYTMKTIKPQARNRKRYSTVLNLGIKNAFFLFWFPILKKAKNIN